MALFLPNLEERERNPLDSTSNPACYGTLFQVVGSPFTGYARDVRHGYDSLSDKHIGSAANIGNIVANKTPSPYTAVGIGDKNSVQEYLEQRALLLRAPGVARNLFNAVSLLSSPQRFCLSKTEDFAEGNQKLPELGARLRFGTRRAGNARPGCDSECGTAYG